MERRKGREEKLLAAGFAPSGASAPAPHACTNAQEGGNSIGQSIPKKEPKKPKAAPKGAKGTS
eukprot:6237037-Pyramimonas_sp.AAC.1